CRLLLVVGTSREVRGPTSSGPRCDDWAVAWIICFDALRIEAGPAKSQRNDHARRSADSALFLDSRLGRHSLLERVLDFIRVRNQLTVNVVGNVSVPISSGLREPNHSEE